MNPNHLQNKQIPDVRQMLRFFCKRTSIYTSCFVFLLLFGVKVEGQDQVDTAPGLTSINSDSESLHINQVGLQHPTDSTTDTSIGVSSIDTKVAAGIQYDTSFVKRKLRKQDQPLTIFGYYRLFGYGRNMTEPYPNLAPFEKAYGMGDGYREPMLSMTVVGRPSGKTSFATEVFLFTPYDGSPFQDNVITMNLGINFYGNFRTQVGNFGVRAGGIHWYNLSSFTIGVFQILDRFSIFDRTPWEGVQNMKKYDAYFDSGATSPGDLRWNNQPFQGLIINGGRLPENFNFDLFWGKTQPNGGLANGIIDPALSIAPTLDAGSVPNYLGISGDSRFVSNFITGGKIGKTFGKQGHNIAYNLIHSQTALDSIRRLEVTDSTEVKFRVPKRTYQVHSLTFNLNFDKIKITSELALGNYKSTTLSKRWGEALMVRASTDKELTFLPIDVQIYQINKNYFNQNGEIATNSNPEILKDFGLTAGAIGVGGQLALVNQLVHNRRGININTGIDIGPAKFAIGWGWSQEIDPTAAQLSYVHRINGLALSRVYNPFPAGAVSPTVFGPYQRKLSFFRGVSGIVQTTDLDPATAEAINRKYFQAVDLQGKLGTSLFDRDLNFFYLGSFNTAKSGSSLLPTFSDDSYLFVQYHEFDVYYEVLPKFILTGYFGIENARGGQFTQWDAETQLPLDQLGTGIGVGFDWTVSESTGIYFRHRWMNFKDRSFTLDKYKGREVTIELKTFF